MRVIFFSLAIAKTSFCNRSFPPKCCQCFFIRFWDARSGIRLQLRARYFVSSPKRLDRLLGPRSPLLNGCRGFFLEVKLPLRGVNHSPSTAMFKNEWSSASFPPMYVHAVDRRNVAFTFLPYCRTCICHRALRCESSFMRTIFPHKHYSFLDDSTCPNFQAATVLLTCRDEALAAVTVKGGVFWDVAPFSLAVTHQITWRRLSEVTNLHSLTCFLFGQKVRNTDTETKYSGAI